MHTTVNHIVADGSQMERVEGRCFVQPCKFLH